MKLENELIWIPGSRGMVASALVDRLKNYQIMLTDRDDLDLTNNLETDKWLAKNRPSIIFMTAAKVGGIAANAAEPVDFLLDNLKIQINIIELANKYNVKKIIFFGSACAYPRDASQPIAENEFYAGMPEQTNIWYATAKIAGIKLAQAYRAQHNLDIISVMPTNTYGPNDNYTIGSNHVIPALMQRFHSARNRNENVVEIWGTGSPLREFLFVDDLARAVTFLAENYSSSEIINIGSGEEISILGLAKLIADVVGYKGDIVTNPSKPDGIPRKLLDSNKMSNLGWTPTTDLKSGLDLTYKWAVAHGKLS